MLRRTVLAVWLACATAADVKLGFVYAQFDSSWVVDRLTESHSQFKLAVQQINAQGLLGNDTLSYVAYDSGAEKLTALGGAIAALNDPDVVGIVGTGYSAALEPAAMFCSVEEKPIISPGSTDVSLTDKTSLPYLLRSVPNDDNQAQAFVALIQNASWGRVGVVYHDDFIALAERFEMLAADAGIDVVSSVSIPPDDATWKTEMPLQIVQASGAKIIVGMTRTSSLEWVDFARDLGMFDAGYQWMGLTASYSGEMVDGTNPRFLPGYLYLLPSEEPDTARKVAMDAEWPTVSTKYDCEVYPAFDAATGAPFYDQFTNQTDPTIWDTDYACVGNGLLDFWGQYVYDTAWIYAIAIANLTARGVSPKDGPALLSQLKQTTFAGISGVISFDPLTQDRVKGYELNNLQTAASAPGAAESVRTVELAAVQWMGGAAVMPSDGSEVDPSRTLAEVVCSGSPVYVGQHNCTLTVTFKNSFGEPPLHFDATTDLSVQALSLADAGQAAGLVLREGCDANETQCTFRIVPQAVGDAGIYVNLKTRLSAAVPVAASPVKIAFNELFVMPEVVEEKNLLPLALTYTIWALTAACMVMGLLFLCWARFHSGLRLLQASQPVFLYCIVLGSVMSMSAILPVSFDHRDMTPVANVTSGPGMYPTLDEMCMLQVWLYGLGFVITYGCLFAKLYRVMRGLPVTSLALRGRIMINPSMKDVRLTSSTMLLRVTAMLLIEIVLLSVWTSLDSARLYYAVTVDATDSYGRTTESHGTCTADQPWPFMGTMVALHVGLLVYGNVLCYRARDVPTKFNEGKYITMALLNNLQTTLFAVLLGAFLYDTPVAFLVIKWMAVVASDFGTLCFIFLPKIYLFHFGNYEGHSDNHTSRKGTTRNGSVTGTSSGNTTRVHPELGAACRYEADSTPPTAGSVTPP